MLLYIDNDFEFSYFDSNTGLKLNYSGTIKEFPDLKDNLDWRKIAIERFKKRIREMNNEEEISQYIINDLKKYGYIPKLKQKKGFRIQRI